MSPIHEKGRSGRYETDLRTSIHRYGRFGGQTTKKDSPVHEKSGFCGHENEIVASVHEMCRLGGHDGQFEVYALEKGHSDDRTQQMRKFGDLARGTKQAARAPRRCSRSLL